METDAPLVARAEEPRAGVRRATALHGLAGPYFNSGVLRFALDHPAIGPALDRALAAAADPAVPLVFHDQCALNIGFEGLTAAMSERFNAFLWPEQRAVPDDAAVLHFLDRPKPWEPLYPAAAREWWGWRALVRRLCGDTVA
jgi:lipopolysaccharide biosynthesis glycosyltransferase